MDEIVLWRDGDPYAELSELVRRVGQATVVSENGSARLLDVPAGLHLRLPLEGGHRMMDDAAWMPMSSFKLTPCGLTVAGRGFWRQGTPVRLVLEGHVAQWIATAVGRETLTAILEKRRPTSRGHPTSPCHAAYCIRLEEPSAGETTPT